MVSELSLLKPPTLYVITCIMYSTHAQLNSERDPILQLGMPKDTCLYIYLRVVAGLVKFGRCSELPVSLPRQALVR